MYKNLSHFLIRSSKTDLTRVGFCRGAAEGRTSYQTTPMVSIDDRLTSPGRVTLGN